MSTSVLASLKGRGPHSKWKGLFDRLPLHEIVLITSNVNWNGIS